jgi:signal transduction histidine kinase
VVSNFEQQANDAVDALSNTLIRHTNLLLAMQGLFHASDEVSRLEFQSFIRSIDAGNNFPEAAALSWNAIVPAQQLNAFEQMVRADTSLQADGYPDFEIRPVVENQAAIVVAYTEPMAGNERAFGFNIASNPDRLAAVEHSRDSGDAVITAPITLAQETGSQKAFLMLLPIYRPMSPTTLEQRRNWFDGLVVAVFRGGDLIQRSAKADFSYFQVQDITDKTVPIEDSLLFAEGKPLSGNNHLQSYREINIGSRTWQLDFQRSLDEHSAGTSITEVVIASLGALASLLAAMLFSALASSRRQAQAKAKRLTADLQLANEELIRSNSDLSQFAHVASHDLQTPVRNVISAVALLEDHLGENIDSKAQECLVFLDKSATRMRTLVTDLLNYARLGRDAIEFEQTDLNDVVREAHEATLEQITASNSQLNTDKLPVVSGDARQLQRVFENLVVNSIKYAHIDRSPEIDITYEGLVSLPINNTSNAQTRDVIQLLFSDNGQGIGEEFHDIVFLPFRRLHRHDEITGSGLGLGICKQILERHGGSIVIKTSSDKGTSFLISLPKETPAGNSQ